MSTPVDTHCLSVLENGLEVPIGFVEEHECEHHGPFSGDEEEQ